MRARFAAAARLSGRQAPQRVAVQGVVDLSMSFCGGLAGFASGFVRRAVGFHLLAAMATIAAGLLLVAATRAIAAARTQPVELAPR